MENVKVEFNPVAIKDTVLNVGGQDVVIKNALPYEEKEQFAFEQANATVVTNEETGVVYQSYQYDVAFAYLFVKYLTNIDVDGLDDDDDGQKKVYDFVFSENLIGRACDCNDELERTITCVEEIYDLVYTAVEKTHTAKNSLSHRIMTSLGSILTDEDLATSLAKAQDVNGQMIDMMGAVMRDKKVNANVFPMKFSKK